MKYSIILTTAVAINNVYAISFADVGNTLSSYSSSSIDVVKRATDAIPTLFSRKDSASCPAIWTKAVTDLKKMFLDTSNGQCNDDARAAIRAAFHDCGTWDQSQGSSGGCDGSLILGDELGLPENFGLADYAAKLLALRNSTPAYAALSVADWIQVASSVAIVTCPGGPRVTTYVGRKDNPHRNPANGLPNVHSDANTLFALFQKKGFSAVDLAALLGAHSTSKAFGQLPDIPNDPPGAQDSTPGLWDVKYYQETLTPPKNVYPFQSDVVLAAHPTVGKEFKGFVGNQGKWTGKFADAMLKMSLLGVPGASDPSKNLIDCTGAIPKGTSSKREMKGAPINDRIR